MKKKLLDYIILPNGRMNGYRIRKPEIIEKIIKYTPLLDPYEVHIRERVYFLKENFKEIPKCIYCSNKKKYCLASSPKYFDTCNNRECSKRALSEHSKRVCEKRWKNHIKPEKKIISKEERYKNAVATRRKNNPDWFTPEQKINVTQKRQEYFSIEQNRLDANNKLKERWSNKELREKQSDTIRKLISDGVFTPPITNSWTHWDSIYTYNNKEYKFRSSWEAAFWSAYKHLKFEELRIPYLYEGKTHTYIVDFIDYDKRVVYEIKPTDRYLEKEIVKEKYLKQWCLDNNYEYIFITNNWFKINYNLIDFENNNWLLDRMKQFSPTK